MSEEMSKTDILKAIWSLIVILCIGIPVYNFIKESKEDHDNYQNKIENQYNTLKDMKFYITQNVQNGSSLHKALSSFSDLTDVQRKDVIKKFTGELVGVETNVKNIRQDDDFFIIDTITFIGIDYEIKTRPIDAANSDYIKSLHKGDKIRFLGYISGISWGNLYIYPAIVIDNMKRSTNKKSFKVNELYLADNYQIPFTRITELKKKADKGDLKSAYRVGTLLYDNPDTFDDREKARDYLTKSAKDGNPYAYGMLLRLLYDEASSDHDSDQMDKLEKQAKTLLPTLLQLAKKGIPEAQYIVGRIYIAIIGDREKGVAFYKDACSHNNMDACRFLGNISLQNEDYINANKYYTICASLGDKKCKNNILNLDANINKAPSNKPQTVKIKFEGCSGSEEMGNLYGFDQKGKEIGFLFDYEKQDNIFKKCDSLKQGSYYTVTYVVKKLDPLSTDSDTAEFVIEIK